MALQRYPLNRFDTSIAGAGASYFIGDVFGDLPTSGLRVGDLGYTVNDGKLWAANSSTTFVEKGAAGAAGPAGPPGGGSYATNTFTQYINRTDYASDALAGTALKAAVTTLNAANGGTIIIWPGNYDLGSTPVVVSKPISFYGFGGRSRPLNSTAHMGPRLQSSAKHMFEVSNGANIQGCAWVGLGFLHNYTGGGTYDTDGACIFMDNLSYFRVEDNFFHTETGHGFTGSNFSSLIKANSNDGSAITGYPGGATANDSSWNSIRNNIGYGRLVRAATHMGGASHGTNGNLNGWNITGNTCFGGLATDGTSHQNPAIYLAPANRCQITYNTFEQGWNPAIRLENSYGNIILGNGGENGTGATTVTSASYFTELVNSDGTLCEDMGVHSPSTSSSASAGMSMLYHITGGGDYNTFRQTYGPSGGQNGYAVTVTTNAFTAGAAMRKDTSGLGTHNVFWPAGATSGTTL